jgi:hypothetical protein
LEDLEVDFFGADLRLVDLMLFFGTDLLLLFLGTATGGCSSEELEELDDELSLSSSELSFRAIDITFPFFMCMTLCGNVFMMAPGYDLGLPSLGVVFSGVWNKLRRLGFIVLAPGLPVPLPLTSTL